MSLPLGQHLFIDLITYLILLHSFSYFLSVFFLCSAGINVKKFISITFFSMLIYFIGNELQRLHTIFCYISVDTSKNKFSWLFLCLDFTWIRIAFLDHVMEKVLHTIFGMNFVYVAHFNLNTVIHIHFLINVLYNSSNY